MFQDMTAKPSEFLPMLYDRLKDASFASKTPLFQHLFEDLLDDQAPELIIP